MRKFFAMLVVVVGCLGATTNARAQFCPGVSPWVFDDVLASDPFCGFITKMAQQNVTLGCIVIDANHRLYCPNDSVTRKQMAAFMARLGDALFPLTCAAGQVLKWNGSAWACANDNGGGGGGTVTSVLAGIGLQGSPNPITGAGSLNLAASYQLPQACTNGQVPKSNGSGGWACAADAGGAGTVTSITAGTGLTGGTITGSGTIGVDTAYVQRRVSATCAVGSSIRAIAADGSVTCQSDNAGPANAFVQGGNAFAADAVLGTTDANRAVNVIAGNTRVMRFEPNANGPNLLGGHPNNSIGTFEGQTVGGGGAPGVDCYDPLTTTFTRSCANHAAGPWATIGGGFSNRATAQSAVVAGGFTNSAQGNFSAVGGGRTNTAEGAYSTVAGGEGNTASGLDSTVGGGLDNTASGAFSTIPGGLFNFALGSNSFAAGVRAVAVHENSFVWGGSATLDTTTLADGDFFVYAPSRIRLFAGTAGTGGCEVGTGNIGGNLSCAGTVTATSFVPSSDRAQKSRIVAVDVDDVLTRVIALPITQWSYNAVPEVRHLGPMGQDFHAAFGLGATDKGIATVDADGVALAAIQGLNAKLEAKIAEQARQLAEERAARLAQAAEIAERLTQTESLRSELAALRSMLAALLDERKQVANAW